MKIKYWFTSDLHFNHRNIIKYCKRPFNSVEEMNQVLIKNWNTLVSVNDIIYILGDFTFLSKTKEIKLLLDQLNGKKILIKGNHDRIGTDKAYELGFNAMMHECILKIDKKLVRLHHYPYKKKNLFRTLLNLFLLKKYDNIYNPIDDGKILLHGHTHQKDKIRKNMIHVGVESWGFKPVSEHQIIELMRNYGL